MTRKKGVGVKRVAPASRGDWATTGGMPSQHASGFGITSRPSSAVNRMTTGATGAGGAPGQPDFAPGLPYDPNVAQAIEGAGHQRDLTIQGVDGSQAAFLTQMGANADGTLNLSDPRSRAYALQAKWKAAKTGAYQTAGHKLYSGAYQEVLRGNAEGETTDFGQLQGDVGQGLAGFNQQRLGAVGEYGQQVGGILGEYGGRLATAPDPTVAPKTAVAGAGPTASVANGNQQAHGGAPKVVVKNGKVYHYYPDGKIMYVRKAS